MAGIEGGEASTSTHAQVETASGRKHKGGGWGWWLLGEGFVINRQTILRWGGALLIALLFFYGLDLAVMAAQGLPLNFDLTPAQ